MPDRSKFVPLWFVGVLAILVTSQVIRLLQTGPVLWIVCDYSGRLCALAFLWIIPAARAMAYQQQPLRTSWWETMLWMIGMIVLFGTVCQWISHFVNAAIPGTKLGSYPILHGKFYIFDLTFGMVLVAIQEEIIFRRCAREVFGARWGQGFITILICSLLFAAYHWTTGLGNMMGVFFFGIYAMLFLRRTGALWPLIVAHALNDFVQFSGLFR
jgi:membrane protease YdiL (CAAX protease family)